ncbi:hypothetical protein R6Z07F_009453 [Ovis aries]
MGQQLKGWALARDVIPRVKIPELCEFGKAGGFHQKLIHLVTARPQKGQTELANQTTYIQAEQGSFGVVRIQNKCIKEQRPRCGQSKAREQAGVTGTEDTLPNAAPSCDPFKPVRIDKLGSRTASGWRLITERPSLLEAGSPKSRCEQGCGPSEGSGQEFFLDTWLLVTLILWDVDFRQEKQNDRVWFTFYLGNSPGGRGSSKILQRDVCESYRRPWRPGVKRALEKVLMSQGTNTHEIV